MPWDGAGGKKGQTLTLGGAAKSRVGHGGVPRGGPSLGWGGGCHPTPSPHPDSPRWGAVWGPAHPIAVGLRPPALRAPAPGLIRPLHEQLPGLKPPRRCQRGTSGPGQGGGSPLLGHRTVKQKFAGMEVAHCLEAHFLFFHL